jgi:ketosteroid isomerase-like protein
MADGNESSLEKRLDHVESQIAISDLVHEYARLIRRDQSQDVAALFTQDAVFEVRDGHPDQQEFSVRSRIEGRRRIHDYMTQGKGRPHPVPLIHNLVIAVDDDAATGNCVMEGKIYGSEHKVYGEYRDSFKRVEGRWLFASRAFTMFAVGSSI